MSVRLRCLVTAISIVAIGLPITAMALEKEPVRIADIDRPELEEWNRGYTCSVAYYNFCTGWTWVWSGFPAETRLGAHFTACCSTSTDSVRVTGLYMYFYTGVPAGYGFTGSFDAWAADSSGCPTAPSLASQALPPLGEDWNFIDFGGPVLVPNEFVLTYTLGATEGSPMATLTDSPFTDLGVCYPGPRVARSAVYGTPGSPECPGSTFWDGAGDAELLMAADLNCEPVVSVEGATWGGVKSLYR
jgi:hypothetical protein